MRNTPKGTRRRRERALVQLGPLVSRTRPKPFDLLDTSRKLCLPLCIGPVLKFPPRPPLRTRNLHELGSMTICFGRERAGFEPKPCGEYKNTSPDEICTQGPKCKHTSWGVLAIPLHVGKCMGRGFLKTAGDVKFCTPPHDFDRPQKLMTDAIFAN